ncbi:hypothetical protein UACE39S_02849 [Ureibacillus acetophenoni]
MCRTVLLRQIVASLGLMVLNRDDRLSFSFLQEGEKKPMFRRKGATNRKAFLQIVSEIEEASFKGRFTIEEGFKELPKDNAYLSLKIIGRFKNAY